MVYDSAQFVGVPWETIIKTYRAGLGERSFPTLRQQAAHFLGFFNATNPLFPPEAQESANELVFSTFFRAMLGYIDGRLEEATAEGEEVTEEDIAKLVADVIRESHETVTTSEPHPAMPEGFFDDVKREYAEHIDASIDVLESLPLGDDARDQLVDLAAALVTQDNPNPFSPFHSGVVIAGFGRDEYFPSLFEFELETIALSRLKYTQSNASTISRS